MSICNGSIGSAFGFHSSSNKKVLFFGGEGDFPPLSKGHFWTNLTNVLSWIPGLCLISAVYHLYRASQAEKASLKAHMFTSELLYYANALRARAITEIFQVSSLFIFVDTGVSIGRFCL
jgi:hypothetical protein